MPGIFLVSGKKRPRAALYANFSNTLRFKDVTGPIVNFVLVLSLILAVSKPFSVRLYNVTVKDYLRSLGTPH